MAKIAQTFTERNVAVSSKSIFEALVVQQSAAISKGLVKRSKQIAESDLKKHAKKCFKRFAANMLDCEDEHEHKELYKALKKRIGRTGKEFKERFVPSCAPVKVSLRGELYSMQKKATRSQQRALRIGDVLETYYKDSNEPQIEIVVCLNSEYAPLVVAKDKWGSRNKSSYAWLNTDRWKCIGHMNFNLKSN